MRTICIPAHDASYWLRSIATLLLINTGLGILLSVSNPEMDWATTQLFSHCVGFALWILNLLFSVFISSEASPGWRIFLIVPLGLVVGYKAAALLGAPDALNELWVNPRTQWRSLVTGLLTAAAATLLFISLYRAHAYRLELEAEQRRAAELKQAETAAQLAMLQAQIEPHFLFNTLANVQSLIDRDPALARTMLEHLNDYLRATLGRTRSARTTLGDEVALLEALLGIIGIRLGERLRYHIDVPDHLRDASLPPLLLQPLVENAIEHGIEPALAGGTITVQAREDNGLLQLSVTDTGAGLSPAPRQGVGLANIRERLANLYGDAGHLQLFANTPTGVRAELQLPLRNP